MNISNEFRRVAIFEHGLARFLNQILISMTLKIALEIGLERFLSE